MSAITMLFWLAFLAIRDIRPARSWLYLVLACVSTIALFLSLASRDIALPQTVNFVVGFLNVPHLVFVWLFALSVFQTKFRLSFWHVATGIIYTLPLFWFRAYQSGILPEPHFILNVCISIGSMAFMAHLVWVILRERKGDLLEKRKRSRWAFVSVLVVVTIVTALVDLYLITAWPPHARLIKAATLWPPVFAAFFWIVRASKGRFIANERPQSFVEAQSQITAKDALVFEKLQNRIKEDRIYLDPDLTVSRLAKDLGVTSHRLRTLINQSMGYENFNQFLNAHRVRSILKKLNDPALDHVPILTLAFDGGFRSLSPFNKAFKDIMGQTPSQYRKTRPKNAET